MCPAWCDPGRGRADSEMGERIASYLRGFLDHGAWEIGQVAVRPGFALCHVEDVERNGLEEFRNPHDAIVIARYDDAGQYRPLKTAPNLKHGWQLLLRNENEMREALDFLYPAAAGTAELFARHALPTVDLRTTLGRQTGMYAVTKNLSDEEARELTADFCARGCLRRILWEISPGQPVANHPPASAMPLLCAEACNLFVAKAREVVKGRA